MSRRTIQRCREWNARECSCDEAGGEGEGEEKKRPRDEFHPETRKGSGEGKVERIRSNSWNRERRGFLLIYALKMPIDIYRYCHSRAAARPVSRGYSRNLNSISPWYFK